MGAETERPRSRIVGGLALVLVAGSGLYGTGFWLTHDPGPPAEAFGPAAEVIRRAHQPGDLIVLAPFYATRAREQLGDLLPVSPRDPLNEDLGPHPRIWIFGLFGAAEELRPRLLQVGLQLEESLTPSPGIVVDRYRNLRREEVVYDFTARLADARVFHEKDGARVPCNKWEQVPGPGGRGKWVCPYDSEWFYVGPEWHYMDDEQRYCLWAHPPSQGRLLIEYPRVPLTGRLTGRAGHTLNGSVRAKAPIDFDVTVGEALPQRFTLPLEERWRPVGLVTPTTGTTTVSFAVSTSNAGINHFCFDLDVRKEAAP